VASSSRVRKKFILLKDSGQPFLFILYSGKYIVSTTAEKREFRRSYWYKWLSVLKPVAVASIENISFLRVVAFECPVL